MEEKLAMASYNNPYELLNKRSYACRHKKSMVTWQVKCGFVFFWGGYANFLFFLVAALLLKCLFSQDYLII